MLTGHFGIILMALLWLLICFRFWRLAGPQNPGQRHLLAIAGGLGAGLIYLLGTMVMALLKAPAPGEEEKPLPVRGEDVRIAPARGSDAP